MGLIFSIVHLIWQLHTWKYIAGLGRAGQGWLHWNISVARLQAGNYFIWSEIASCLSATVTVGEKYVYFSAKTNITQWDHWEANDAWYQTQLLIEIFQQINSHFLSPLSSIRSPEFSCCKVKSNYWLIRIKRLPRVDSSRGWWFVIILEEPERQLINQSVTIK